MNYKVIIKQHRFSKYNFLGIMLVFFASLSNAQTVEKLELSLQKAIEIGIEQRLDLKNQRLQTKIAENDISKQSSKNLPQITATADFRYNTLLQTNILPGSALGGGPDRAIQFGLPYNNSIAFNLKQNIYDPNNHFDQKITKTNSESEKLKLQQSIIDIKLIIADAYYTVLLNQERFNLSKSNFSRYQANLEVAKQKFENKNLIKSDYDRSNLDFQNAIVSLQKDSSTLELSKMNLLNQLNVKQDITLVLTEDLKSLTTKEVPNFETSQTERVELSREKVQLTVNELNVKKQEHLYYPTVQLYANQTFQQLSREFKFFDGTTWYPFNYFGLQVNIPIFDGLLKGRTRTEYVMKKQINQNNIQKLKTDIDYELRSSFTSFQNAFRSLQYAKENYAQAKELVIVYENRYKQGSALNSDLINTNYSLQVAQNNLMNAYYDFLLSKLKWMKAKAEL